MSAGALPRVMRTPLFTQNALIAEGVMFADGKRRILVPEATPDDLIEEITQVLVEDDEKAERLARGLEAVRRLLAAPVDPASDLPDRSR